MMSRTELHLIIGEILDQHETVSGDFYAVFIDRLEERLDISSLQRKAFRRGVLGAMRRAYENGATRPAQIATAVADWVLEQVNE